MKIEKGIPLPGEDRGRKPRGTYSDVVEKLEVGDSFVAEGTSGPTMQSAIRAAAKRAGIKVTIRNITSDDDVNVKLRVWRIES